jgi:hypothetical protein
MFLAMPHVYNRRAFGSVVRHSFDPAHDDSLRLLVLYSALVRLELTLKDHDASLRSKGHDVCSMLQDLGGDASLVDQLANRLQALWCVLKDGRIVLVDPKQYPGIRYLCHESDFPGKSTTQQLEDALDVLRDIERELTSKGIAL